MNSTREETSQEYKECAGKGCKNLAKIPLKIEFIDKGGFFCESCAADLVRDGLAIAAGEQIDKPL